MKAKLLKGHIHQITKRGGNAPPTQAGGRYHEGMSNTVYALTYSPVVPWDLETNWGDVSGAKI